MELIKEPITVGEILADFHCEVPVEGDLIVPDVKPDILKVLQVDATAYLSGRELSEGKAVLSGRVDMTVLYIPDCEEVGLQNLRTSFEFSYKQENRAILKDACVLAEAEVVRAEFHVINSRKISLRAVVGIDCEVSGIRQIELAHGVSGVYAEEKKDVLCLNSVVCSRSEKFMMKETIEVPAGKSAIGEILKVDLKIGEKEMKPITGKVVAKGVLQACVLYMSKDARVEFMEVDIPFTEVFDLPGIYEELPCQLDFHIHDCRYDACVDSAGEKRLVNLDVIVGADMRAIKQSEIEVLEDCYCPGYDTQLQFCQEKLNEVIASPACQNTLREVVVMDKALPQIAGVYNIITKPMVISTNLEAEKLEVEGRIDAYILYLTDQEQMPVYSYKKEIPFRYLLDAPQSEAGVTCAVRAEIEHTSFHLNMANEVELRCILNLSAEIVRNRTVSILEHVQLLPVSDEDKKGIVIYFVQPGDTLWSIAKRYRVPMADILENNQILDAEPILPGTRLVIPACRRAS